MEPRIPDIFNDRTSRIYLSNDIKYKYDEATKETFIILPNGRKYHIQNLVLEGTAISDIQSLSSSQKARLKLLISALLSDSKLKAEMTSGDLEHCEIHSIASRKETVIDVSNKIKERISPHRLIFGHKIDGPAAAAKVADAAPAFDFSREFVISRKIAEEVAAKIKAENTAGKYDTEEKFAQAVSDGIFGYAEPTLRNRIQALAPWWADVKLQLDAFGVAQYNADVKLARQYTDDFDQPLDIIRGELAALEKSGINNASFETFQTLRSHLYKTTAYLVRQLGIDFTPKAAAVPASGPVAAAPTPTPSAAAVAPVTPTPLAFRITDEYKIAEDHARKVVSEISAKTYEDETKLYNATSNALERSEEVFRQSISSLNSWTKVTIYYDEEHPKKEKQDEAIDALDNQLEADFRKAPVAIGSEISQLSHRITNATFDSFQQLQSYLYKLVVKQVLEAKSKLISVKAAPAPFSVELVAVPEEAPPSAIIPRHESIRIPPSMRYLFNDLISKLWQITLLFPPAEKKEEQELRMIHIPTTQPVKEARRIAPVEQNRKQMENLAWLIYLLFSIPVVAARKEPLSLTYEPDITILGPSQSPPRVTQFVIPALRDLFKQFAPPVTPTPPSATLLVPASPVSRSIEFKLLRSLSENLDALLGDIEEEEEEVAESDDEEEIEVKLSKSEIPVELSKEDWLKKIGLVQVPGSQFEPRLYQKFNQERTYQIADEIAEKIASQVCKERYATQEDLNEAIANALVLGEPEFVRRIKSLPKWKNTTVEYGVFNRLQLAADVALTEELTKDLSRSNKEIRADLEDLIINEASFNSFQRLRILLYRLTLLKIAASIEGIVSLISPPASGTTAIPTATPPASPASAPAAPTPITAPASESSATPTITAPFALSLEYDIADAFAEAVVEQIAKNRYETQQQLKTALEDALESREPQFAQMIKELPAWQLTEIEYDIFDGLIERQVFDVVQLTADMVLDKQLGRDFSRTGVEIGGDLGALTINNASFESFQKLRAYFYKQIALKLAALPSALVPPTPSATTTAPTAQTRAVKSPSSDIVVEIPMPPLQEQPSIVFPEDAILRLQGKMVSLRARLEREEKQVQMLKQATEMPDLTSQWTERTFIESKLNEISGRLLQFWQLKEQGVTIPETTDEEFLELEKQLVEDSRKTRLELETEFKERSDLLKEIPHRPGHELEIDQVVRANLIRSLFIKEICFKDPKLAHDFALFKKALARLDNPPPAHPSPIAEAPPFLLTAIDRHVAAVQERIGKSYAELQKAQKEDLEDPTAEEYERLEEQLRQDAGKDKSLLEKEIKALLGEPQVRSVAEASLPQALVEQRVEEPISEHEIVVPKEDAEKTTEELEKELFRLVQTDPESVQRRRSILLKQVCIANPNLAPEFAFWTSLKEQIAKGISINDRVNSRLEELYKQFKVLVDAEEKAMVDEGENELVDPSEATLVRLEQQLLEDAGKDPKDLSSEIDALADTYGSLAVHNETSRALFMRSIIFKKICREHPELVKEIALLSSLREVDQLQHLSEEDRVLETQLDEKETQELRGLSQSLLKSLKDVEEKADVLMDDYSELVKKDMEFLHSMEAEPIEAVEAEPMPAPPASPVPTTAPVSPASPSSITPPRVSSPSTPEEDQRSAALRKSLEEAAQRAENLLDNLRKVEKWRRTHETSPTTSSPRTPVQIPQEEDVSVPTPTPTPAPTSPAFEAVVKKTEAAFDLPRETEKIRKELDRWQDTILTYVETNLPLERTEFAVKMGALMTAARAGTLASKTLAARVNSIIDDILNSLDATSDKINFAQQLAKQMRIRYQDRDVPDEERVTLIFAPIRKALTEFQIRFDTYQQRLRTIE